MLILPILPIVLGAVMEGPKPADTQARKEEWTTMRSDLRAWFEREGMLRYAVVGDEHCQLAELECAPLVALGPGDGDYVEAPHPEEARYRGRSLAEMSLEEYNRFVFRWLEAAIAADDVRCAQCGRAILPDDDLPDPDTWDAILIEQELVAWMVVHFDCKKKLAKKLKGLHPFELVPRESPRYDLSAVPLDDEEEAARDATNHG